MECIRQIVSEIIFEANIFDTSVPKNHEQLHEEETKLVGDHSYVFMTAAVSTCLAELLPAHSDSSKSPSVLIYGAAGGLMAKRLLDAIPFLKLENIEQFDVDSRQQLNCQQVGLMNDSGLPPKSVDVVIARCCAYNTFAFYALVQDAIEVAKTGGRILFSFTTDSVAVSFQMVLLG